MLRLPFQHLSLSEVVWSWDFMLAVFAGFGAFGYYVLYPPLANAQASAYGGLLYAYMGLSVGIFAANLAAYAIFTSLTDSNLVVFLKRIRALGGYLDAFLMTAYISLITVALTGGLWLIFSSPASWEWDTLVKSGLHAFVFGWVAYTVSSAAMLVSNITDFFTRRTEFYDVTLGLDQVHIEEYLEGLSAEEERLAAH